MASVKWTARFFLMVWLCYLSTPCLAWGFFGHKTINRLAVFTLPPEMFGFYKENIEWITEHAVDPDKRRYAVQDEACRHFIDADRYEKSAPIDTIPHFWKDAVAKYTKDTLENNGIVPWHIRTMMYRLTDAFRARDKWRILKVSADLGHYIADAHVPLHSTENYNGQLTGQVGIHGFWESRLPELFCDDYDLFTGQAQYISDIQEAAWIAVNGSFAALDSVLRFERQLSATFPEDRKFSFESRGNQQVKVYSKEYSSAYHQMLGDQVERRLRASVLAVGSFWYTAWVDAGQPDLSKLQDQGMTEEEKTDLDNLTKKYQNGQIIGRPEPHDE